MAISFSRTLRSLEQQRSRGWVTLGAVVVLAGVGTWLTLARVPVYEVSPQARLEVSRAAHPLAASVAGRVVRAEMQLGRQVAEGDVLVELDGTDTQLAVREKQTRVTALEARRTAIDTEIAAERETLTAQKQARSQSTEELTAQITKAESQAKFTATQAERAKKLRESKTITESEAEKTLADAETACFALVEAKAAIQRLERDLAERQVRAPVAGRIGEVSEVRVGSVVQAAQKLCSIVPTGSPRAVAQFVPVVVGRLKPGQPARLRLDGFPWMQFGTLDARVSNIDTEPRDGFVRVELSLSPKPTSKIPLDHGLTGSVEIEVERVSPAVLLLRAAGQYLGTRRSGEARNSKRQRGRDMSRRFFAPEVVQTSAMDCGPASLASLLGGFGVRVSYGRLREACQTDVDGTSIDTLEVVANRLGLACEQVMLPLDHLLLDESAALPAIVVTKHGVGYTHFVVAWRRHGKLIQVMGPATGRRWMRASHFLRDVYTHTQRVPAEAFDAWVRSDDFQKVLARRMHDLGIGRASHTLLANAASEPTWRGFGALDAAIRLTASLVESGSVRRGRQAHDMIAGLWRRALVDEKAIPQSFWFVSGTALTGDVMIRGAVLVRALGVQKPAADSEPLSLELSAALTEEKPRPWRAVGRILGSGSTRAMWSIVFVAVLIASLSLVETVMLRGFIDLGRDLGLVEQRLIALGLIVGVGLIELLLELRMASGLLRLGRSLEVRFRLAFAEKLPKLNDRYFHSRPVSDMAERSHSVQTLRQLPKLFGAMTQTSVLLVLTAVSISLFDPASAPLALLAAFVSLALPLVFRPWLMEADMRVRTHSGALSRFYFDAMQGLTMIKAHAAERIVQREQEGLLVEWFGAARKHLSIVLLLETLQVSVGFTLAGVLLVRHVDVLADTGGALLLAYWALSLPELGAALAALVRQYPWQRNTLLRLLEPLSAPETKPTGEPGGVSSRTGDEWHVRGLTPTGSPNLREKTMSGVALSFADVTVIAGGHTILRNITLDIAAGSHVAVVGPSGAGKSSLVGLLLGWHRAAAGEVRADGEPLDAERLDELRRQTAWVDPAVHLWNRSLVDNLRFGHLDTNAERLGQVCAHAELIDVLEKLPDGLQTSLGEGGGLLSGGQGQRVRLGRALLLDDARLVLLDEPFRGLDHGKRRELTRRVREHFAGATLLFVSHDVGDTRDFDRVIVIDAGQVVEDAPPADLIANELSLYRRLLDAEDSVRRNVWQHECWRRLRVDASRVTEEAKT